MTSMESQNGDCMSKWKTTFLSGTSHHLPSVEAGRRHKLLQGIKRRRCWIKWNGPHWIDISPFLMQAKIDEKYHLSTLRVRISHTRSSWVSASEWSWSSIIRGPGLGSHSDDPINGGTLRRHPASKAPDRLRGCNINFLSAFKGLQMFVLVWAGNTCEVLRTALL